MLDPEIIRHFDPKAIEYDRGDALAYIDPELEEEAEEEDRADQPLADPDEANLFGDEEQEESIPVVPRASWPEVKAQLNHWGKVFSEDSHRRSEAATQIFSLFEQVTFSYKTLLENDPDEGQKKRYAAAVYELRSLFFGEQEAPLRFLKKIYPEELFYSALYHTLGISIDRESSEDAQTGEEVFAGEDQLFNGASAYSARKGATYVTYFVSTLRFFCLRRARKLCRDHAHEAHIFAQNTYESQLQEAGSDTESQVIQAEELRRQTEAMVGFGELVITARLCGEKLPIQKAFVSDGVKKPGKSAKPDHLELFYSFKLVNFSRFATSPVEQRADTVLLGAADPAFLRFSTTIQDLSYRELVAAELSQQIMEEKLYRFKEGEPVLQQKAAAVYRGCGKGEISRIFSNVKGYLRGSWDFLTED